MADGYKGTLKASGIYAESVEFPILFRVEGCCNNKPTLSSQATDGGIGRIVRVIHYPVQYVNPDPNNEHEAILNLEMGQILTTDAIRNTYVRLLIQRFINTVSLIRKVASHNK